MSDKTQTEALHSLIDDATASMDREVFREVVRVLETFDDRLGAQAKAIEDLQKKQGQLDSGQEEWARQLDAIDEQAEQLAEAIDEWTREVDDRSVQFAERLTKLEQKIDDTDRLLGGVFERLEEIDGDGAPEEETVSIDLPREEVREIVREAADRDDMYAVVWELPLYGEDGGYVGVTIGDFTYRVASDLSVEMEMPDWVGSTEEWCRNPMTENLEADLKQLWRQRQEEDDQEDPGPAYDTPAEQLVREMGDEEQADRMKAERREEDDLDTLVTDDVEVPPVPEVLEREDRLDRERGMTKAEMLDYLKAHAETFLEELPDIVELNGRLVNVTPQGRLEAPADVLVLFVNYLAAHQGVDLAWTREEEDSEQRLGRHAATILLEGLRGSHTFYGPLLDAIEAYDDGDLVEARHCLSEADDVLYQRLT